MQPLIGYKEGSLFSRAVRQSPLFRTFLLCFPIRAFRNIDGILCTSPLFRQDFFLPGSKSCPQGVAYFVSVFRFLAPTDPGHRENLLSLGSATARFLY